MGKKEEKIRISWIDMARGMAMLLIIVGHCVGIPETLRHIIFSFHVPMFFILSGFVYRKKEKSVRKDLKQLIIPYIAAVCIIIVFQIYGSKQWDWLQIRQILKSACYGYGSNYNDIGLIGALWFLPTTFVTRRIMNLVFSFHIKEAYRAIGFIILMILGIEIGQSTWIPWNVDIAFVAAGFMYVGYLLNKTEKLFAKDILIGCFFIWFAAMKCGQLEISTRTYNLWMVSFAGSIAGSICVMGICEKLKNIKFIEKFLSFVGIHTVLLLCIHDIDWRLPFELWWGFLQQFEGSSFYFILSVFCRLGFDFGILCICVLLQILFRNKFMKRKKSDNGEGEKI